MRTAICACSLPDTSVKEFSVYRSALLFFALVDAFYAIVIKVL
jgi:hypothetical protein